MTDMVTAIIIGVITAALLSSGAYIFAKFKSMGKKYDAIQKGVKALLRDRVVQLYNYYSAKNCIPIYARENVESLRNEYKALGGNGVIDGLVKRLMMMPTDNPGNADYESRDAID
jgi:hypothetical protein